jgi:hypothetical protein
VKRGEKWEKRSEKVPQIDLEGTCRRKTKEKEEEVLKRGK